jgi:sulfite reductase (ferredoxin)
MVQTPTPPTEKLSKVEYIKDRSNYLREPLATELSNDANYFTEDAIQLLKFHGSYQQDNRDNRAKGQEKDYQMMLRTRTPGGFVPPQLYLVLDKLSEDYGNHTLRATTRQAFQLHGVLKKNLKTVMSTLIRNMGSTLTACGDVNRNVMAPPAPFRNRPEYDYAREYAANIADLLTPQCGAYYEIWVDGEKVISGEEKPEVVEARRNSCGHSQNDIEPIYGKHYMPRKFKVSVTVPGDNSIDIYADDLSLVVITNKKGELEGFNILAGGGLGRTHNKEETFARIADHIGYVDKDDVYNVVKAIVATQRDYGDRTNRRHARMKYLIHDWGVKKFKAKVEEYFGKKIKPFKTLPEWKYEDYLGWNEQGDGKLFLGISIENGRIKDDDTLQLKTALRKIVQQYDLPMQLTASQNIIVYEIEPSLKAQIQAILEEHGVITDTKKISVLTRYAMACPALPTCGLAVTESERAIPEILERLEALLTKVGLKNEKIVIRMTGCPNGCARPYLAEIGFVGSAPEKYQVWLGGTPNQTQLAQPYVEKLAVSDLETFFEPLFVNFRDNRRKGESFGLFCGRVGFEALREFSAQYELGSYKKSKSRSGRKHQYRIGVPDKFYQRLKKMSEEKKRPMNQIVTEALTKYFGE